MKTYEMTPHGTWRLEVNQTGQWVTLLDNVSYATAKTALDRIATTNQAAYRLHYLGEAVSSSQSA